MSKQDWTDELRQKMHAHEETPPEGLWDDISASLQKMRPLHNRETARRKWVAAASLAALLTGGALLWWNYTQPSSTQLPSETVPASAIAEAENETPGSLTGEETGPYTELAEGRRNGQASKGNVLVAKAATAKRNTTHRLSDAAQMATQTEPILPEQDKGMGVDANDDAVKENVPQVAVGEKRDKQMAETPVTVNNDEERALLAQLDAMDSKKSGKAKTSDMALFASNAFYSAEGFGPESPVPVYRSAAVVRKETHHEEPLSFGLTVGMPISSKFSVSTGLVYTRQRSDFTITYRNTDSSSDNLIRRTEQKQTLHYLGIPVNFSTTLWHNNRFHTYALVGGQADFNVDAQMKVNGEKVDADKDNVQFSATLGLGARYDFLPFMGVYVEPTAKYYFDNQSDLSNSFKDHPFKFNLQMGLRFLLNKK